MAAMLSACAMTEDVVPIAYAPVDVERVPGAEMIQITVSAIDARDEHRDRIATKINGYGMEMAAIRSDREVVAIVREALIAELRGRGYGQGEAGPRIEIRIDQFQARFRDGSLVGRAEAEVGLEVTVISSSGVKVYGRDLKAKSKRPAQVANGRNAALVLGDALAIDLKALFADERFLRALGGG